MPIWAAYGVSQWALEVVRSGFRLLWADRPPTLTRNPPIFRPPSSLDAMRILDEEVRALLTKQAIEPVNNMSSPGFYCRLFSVPKRSGGCRPVLDLSPLNAFLRKIHFKMETPRSFRDSLLPGDWVTSLDLTDAYFHVLVHPSDRKWLRFRWKDNVFQFRALPFGLSLSPWVFTKVVREVCALAHKEGIRLRAYLDDWAIQAQSQETAILHTQAVLRHAETLGFLVNLTKSDLTPSRNFQFLGMVFDTSEWSVKPSTDRVERLQNAIRALLPRSHASARELAQVLGAMEAMVPLVPLAGVHKRPFQREFSSRWSHQDWEASIPLDDWFSQTTRSWLSDSFLLRGVPITLPPPVAELFTDASHRGWGAHALDHYVSGIWDSTTSTAHINSLELKAVTLALRALAPLLPVGHVRIRSDNATTIAYINRQGGTVSHSLSVEAESLLLWAQENGFSLSAVHVQGKANCLADLLSRPGTIVQTEWTLVHHALLPVWEKFGKPHIDLFATRFNARLPIFVSPVPDPQAWAVDGMELNWAGWEVYAFPPFPLIQAVLTKWRRDLPRMILIAPDWPAQGWYPTLIQDSTDRLPLSLGPRDLIQPRSGITHGNVPMLSLTAWLLSPQP